LVQTRESQEFGTLATTEVVGKLLKTLKQRGVTAEYVQDGKAALKRIQQLIPAGATIMTGASETLRQIGFLTLLKTNSHSWRNLKTEMLQEEDPAEQTRLRRRSVLADYWLGSVHAIAETGELLTASASGSQLPAYAYTSANIIWVAGTQKITPSLTGAMRRVREYVYPLEDQRMKEAGYPGSTVARILIFEREAFSTRKVTLILVGEKLGF
jgi:hypothetical protein